MTAPTLLNQLLRLLRRLVITQSTRDLTYYLAQRLRKSQTNFCGIRYWLVLRHMELILTLYTLHAESVNLLLSRARALPHTFLSRKPLTTMLTVKVSYVVPVEAHLPVALFAMI